jgi:hypothetical protein
MKRLVWTMVAVAFVVIAVLFYLRLPIEARFLGV